MHTAELKALLKRVQHEVDATPTLDPSLKTQLAALDEAIVRALQRTPEQAPDPALASLEDQALVLETRLATDHPLLVQSVRQVIDTLGKMGI
jgi:uncharacterized membrane protein YccC